MPRKSLLSIERLISAERLTTPREHLGVLIEPEADALYAAIATDHTAALRSAPLLDASVGELRARLWRRLGLVGPVILAGHQAEFFHAGVFAKTIAADVLAAKVGGVAAFLTVDSDTPTTTRPAVPCVEGGEARRVFVPIPACDPQLPMEWQPEAPASVWQVFFARMAELLDHPEVSLLPVYVEGWCAGGTKMLDVTDALVRGHAAVERALGLGASLDLRTSRLSRTPEFRAFLAYLVLSAHTFARDYNEAQRAYGARHRVRNKRRPAPLLTITDDRVESPFWICRAGQPRRRLFVAERGDHIDIFADEKLAGRESKSRLSLVGNHAEPWPVELDGWQLRPRALTLSAFARLFVSDLFIHGIGGAKYDEMTEDFAGRFLGVELPPACCVSATLRLPLPSHGVDSEALAAAQRARRDLHFNPQRHLPDLPQNSLRRREELIRQSRALRVERRYDRVARRRVFDEIRAVNHELLHSHAHRAAALEQEWRLLERRRRSDRVALDREYFFAFHPRRTMEQLVQRIRAALGG